MIKARLPIGQKQTTVLGPHILQSHRGFGEEGFAAVQAREQLDKHPS